MIVLLDNYDSFTYNLCHLFASEGRSVHVVRNDRLTVQQVLALKPEAIVLSPGPGRPEEAGILERLVRAVGGTIPILGVCLGHQGIARVYGGTVVEASEQLHGKTSNIALGDSPLFSFCQKEVEVVRYHSLIVDPDTLPEELEVVATDRAGQIMAIQHCQFPVFGVQFHPESYGTRTGKEMVRGFLRVVDAFWEPHINRKEG